MSYSFVTDIASTSSAVSLLTHAGDVTLDLELNTDPENVGLFKNLLSNVEIYQEFSQCSINMTDLINIAVETNSEKFSKAESIYKQPSDERPIELYRINYYVVVHFEGCFFPGIITDFDNTTEVREKCNCFKWKKLEMTSSER